jgi:probable HAF family extracellular repeat protein
MKALILLSAWALLASCGISSAFASSAYTCTIFKYGSATYTSVGGINNKGQVVGTWSDPGQLSHAFLRDADGTTTSLISPSGSDQFTPVGINNLGQIAGPSFIRNADGTFIQIAPAVAPPGHTYSGTQITGINDKGELTGTISADFNGGTGTILVFIRGTDGTYKIIDQSGTGSEPSLLTGPSTIPTP